MEEQTLNTRQAAKYLGIAMQTMANWRYLRKGPAYTCMGRKRNYQVKDLDAYKEKNRVDPEAA